MASWFPVPSLVPLAVCIWWSLAIVGTPFNLTVLHTNDVHAHFVEFNVFGGRCAETEAEGRRCFGGFARQVTKVREIRESTENILYLNAGDFFQGTIWYTLYKYNVTTKYVNMLGLDAMALGNHEFDDGVSGLVPFLQHVKFPVVCCNCDVSEESSLVELVQKSVVLTIGGKKIAIIGYLTPDTTFLADVGDIKLGDEIECLGQELKYLREKEGEDLNIVIVLGHSGFPKDLEIAKKLPGVDIVVGGHSHTFTYTGVPPSVEVPEAEYPAVVDHGEGEGKTLVVQDFSFGKYLGNLWVNFNDQGHLTEYGGNPILLDGSVAQDEKVLSELTKDSTLVAKQGRTIVGRTRVLLRGDRLICRMHECNMGNFLTDAAVHYYLKSKDDTNTGWTAVPIAILNSGAIRASIDEIINKGNITMEDVLSVAPFGNTIDVVVMNGTQMKEVMEISVARYDPTGHDPPGAFLQVSGIRVMYDLSRKPGDRVVRLELRCGDCRVPRFLPLNLTAHYQVALPAYLVDGGDGFSIFADAISHRNTGALDSDVIVEYLKTEFPVVAQMDDRVIFLPEVKNSAHQINIDMSTYIVTVFLCFKFLVLNKVLLTQ